MFYDFNELKRRLAETVALERTLRAERDFRGGAWRLFIELRALHHIATNLETNVPEERLFVERVGPLLQQRMSTMLEKNEVNPISIEIHEGTEIDRFVLQRHLASEDHTVRLDAVSAAAEVSYAAVLPDLVQQLEKESHPFVISKLTKVIGQLGDANHIEFLTPFLEHEDDRIRANTLEGLDAIDDESKYPHVMRLLDDPSPRVKAAALRSIRSLGGTKFSQLVGRMMAHPDVNVRRSVLFVLAGMRNPFARMRLIRYLGDDDPDIRTRAATLLVEYKEPEAAQALIDRMSREENEAVRTSLLEILRKLRERLPDSATTRFDEMVRSACGELNKEDGSRSTEMTEEPPSPSDEAAFLEEPDSEDDLLGELAALSAPGDISPSRAAEMAARKKASEQQNESSQSGTDEDAEAAIKKLLTRLSTPLGALPAAERRKAEGLIRAGKIRNESHLKQWVERNRQKRKLR